MKKMLKVFYLLNAIEGLVGSLVGVFVPIFLLSSGHSLKNVFIYFLLYSLLVFWGFFLAAWLSQKYSLIGVLVLRYFAWFCYLIVLIFLKEADWLIYLLALFSAISAAFFFFPYHIILGKSVTENKIGHQLSRLMIISQSVGLLAPLLATAIIAWLGYHYLFVAAGFLMAVGLFNLRHLPKVKTKINFSWSTWLNYVQKNRSYFWFEFLENVNEEIEGIVWPIYVYLMVGTIWSFGWTAFLSGIGSFVVTWFVGKKIDGWKHSKTFLMAAGALALMWLSRYWGGGYWYYFSTLIMGFLAIIFSMVYNSIIYIKAKHNKYDEFIVFREVPVFLARTCLYLGAIFLVNDLRLFFVSAAIIYCLLAIILKYKSKGIVIA